MDQWPVYLGHRGGAPVRSIPQLEQVSDYRQSPRSRTKQLGWPEKETEDVVDEKDGDHSRQEDGNSGHLLNTTIRVNSCLFVNMLHTNHVCQIYSEWSYLYFVPKKVGAVDMTPEILVTCQLKEIVL